MKTDSRIMEILKQVTMALKNTWMVQPNDARLGEINDDESATVYQLHLSRQQDTFSTFLKWKNHKVGEVTTCQG